MEFGGSVEWQRDISARIEDMICRLIPVIPHVPPSVEEIGYSLGQVKQTPGVAKKGCGMDLNKRIKASNVRNQRFQTGA